MNKEAKKIENQIITTFIFVSLVILLSTLMTVMRIELEIQVALLMALAFVFPCRIKFYN